MYYFRLGSFVKDCDNSELHTGSLKVRKVRSVVRSEIKDMAVRLHSVSMISWNLPTVTVCMTGKARVDNTG